MDHSAARALMKKVSLLRTRMPYYNRFIPAVAQGVGRQGSSNGIEIPRGGYIGGRFHCEAARRLR